MRSPSLRERVFKRCGGYCERCGIPLAEDNFALHHRKLKSRGGEDTVTNTVALHHHCHNLGNQSVHLAPAEATRRGLIVSSWDEPAEVPVILNDNTVVLLTVHGTYNQIGWDGENGKRTDNNSDRQPWR